MNLPDRHDVSSNKVRYILHAAVTNKQAVTVCCSLPILLRLSNIYTFLVIYSLPPIAIFSKYRLTEIPKYDSITLYLS